MNMLIQKYDNEIELEYRKAICVCKIDIALKSNDKKTFLKYSEEYNEIMEEIFVIQKYAKMFE